MAQDFDGTGSTSPGPACVSGFSAGYATRRERNLIACTICNKTTEHVKEAGSREFKCQDCAARKKQEADRNQGAYLFNQHWCVD